LEAVILLAHGAPENLEDVGPYVLRIRHGRPLEQELMEAIRERYRLIGGSPLLQWTERQVAGLQALLREHSDTRKVYFGMRHSAPFIRETVDRMIADGVTSAIAICMAPQFSALTVGAYEKAMKEAIGDRSLQFRLVPSYAKHPQLIRAFAANLQKARSEHPDAFVIFTAHSLPARVLAAGDPYDYEAKETAVRVAQSCKLPDWRFAYQSQGLTSEIWLGPTVESRLTELASKQVSQVLIMPVGFVCDHVEILYDIDIQFRQQAEQLGIQLFRAQSLNDSPEFLELLHQLSTR
jgi:ferrochelatase